MKLVLKLRTYVILSLFLIIAMVIGSLFLSYQLTVHSTPNQLNVSVNPGEMGKWVNPFLGTGGFPSYTSADDIPGVTLPFGMVRLSPDTEFFFGPLFSDKRR